MGKAVGLLADEKGFFRIIVQFTIMRMSLPVLFSISLIFVVINQVFFIVFVGFFILYDLLEYFHIGLKQILRFSGGYKISLLAILFLLQFL